MKNRLLWWVAGLLLVFAATVAADPANRDRSIKNTLISEGGAHYTNHPADPGGPTKYGVTIHDVRRYLKPTATAADVKALTEQQAIEIYRQHYWAVVRADELPRGLDYTVFDYSVNAGVGRGGKALRRAVGAPADTSVVSDAVVRAVGRFKPADLIRAVNAERMRFQMGLGHSFDVFKRGWRNRINSVLAISLEMDSPGVVKRGAGPQIRYSLIPRIGPGKAPDEEDDE